MNALKNVLKFMGLEKCTNSILGLNFQDVDCVKLTISKGLSMGIVGGAMAVKVPQIANILVASSVAGISFASNFLETLAIMINLAYNYRLGNPFSTYGEMPFLTAQNLIIMALILYFNKKSLNILVLFSSFIAGFYALLTPALVEKSLLNSLQISTIFIGVASKLPQIWGNFRAGSTGQLSIITSFLQFAGTVARVLTTLQEVPDVNLIASFVVGATLNGIVLLQIVYYRKAAKRKVSPKKKKQ